MRRSPQLGSVVRVSRRPSLEEVIARLRDSDLIPPIKSVETFGAGAMNIRVVVNGNGNDVVVERNIRDALVGMPITIEWTS